MDNYNDLHIRGCRQNNLKNISLSLPKGKLIVITGVSGSGKSSLAFDTLFAESQRRYLEYLSPQARLWIKQMPKPDVDWMDGLSPSLAIAQQYRSISSRSTVATHTDIYDFLSLLFANIGEQHSPISGKKLTRYTRQQIIETVLYEYPEGTRIQLAAPLNLNKESLPEAILRLQQMGFIRLLINGSEFDPSSDSLPEESSDAKLEVIVDRLEMREGIRDRLSNSIDIALDLSQGILKVIEGKQGPFRFFTETYVCPETSFSFPPLEPVDFNFQSLRGACPHCQGKGGCEAVSVDQLWNKSDNDAQISIRDHIFALLNRFPKKIAAIHKSTWEAFEAFLIKAFNFKPNSIPSKVSNDILHDILYGNAHELAITLPISTETKKMITHWKGIVPLIEKNLAERQSKSPFFDDDFIEWRICPHCQGGRLKPESLFCLIHGKNIHQLCSLSVEDALKEFSAWKFDQRTQQVAKEILPEIISRLEFLERVGLGYLTLNRQASTLSEGEAQRVQLAAHIGAKLSGIIYVLDEPTRGLHRQEVQHLIQVVKSLRDNGNTVVVVEHERTFIAAADHVIEIGPAAGVHGGEVVFQGSYQQLLKSKSAVTTPWLLNQSQLPIPKRRKAKKNANLIVQNVNCHNLHNFKVQVPLGLLVGFCGVSGSGKSTLVLDILAKELHQELLGKKTQGVISGLGTSGIQRLNMIGQRPAGIASRSIPASYLHIMQSIKSLFAATKLAKARGYTADRFNLNKKGGRCEACEGQGKIKVSMQFMPDLFLPCDVCHGTRYHYETLQVTWEGYSIADILGLSAESAYEVFKYIPDIGPKLKLMTELGLEYLTLGQNFNTLSGGEIQRLKLVTELATQHFEPTLYILDEPTAGLHFQDTAKLVKILHRLVEAGHSVLVVEHNTDLLKQADWLIELGPEGGPKGGKLIFEGTPEQIVSQSKKTPTGQALLASK